MNYYEDLTQMMMGGQTQESPVAKMCGCQQPMSPMQPVHPVQPVQPVHPKCPTHSTQPTPPTQPQPSASCLPLGKNHPLFNVDTAFMLGNLFEGLYSPYCGFTNFPLQATNQEEALLYQVLAYQFAAHELNLLLDNDPKNEKLIQLFNEYNNMYEKLLNQYTQQFRPLFVNNCNNTNHWMWIHSPWPWENR